MQNGSVTPTHGDLEKKLPEEVKVTLTIEPLLVVYVPPAPTPPPPKKVRLPLGARHDEPGADTTKFNILLSDISTVVPRNQLSKPRPGTVVLFASNNMEYALFDSGTKINPEI